MPRLNHALATRTAIPRPKPFFISEQQILDGLRRFIDRFPQTPTTNGFDLWPSRPFTSQTVIRRFGSWRLALGRIGFKRVRKRHYSARELIAEFERLWDAIGKRPGAKAVRRHGRISVTPYVNRWGTIRRVGELVARLRAGEIERTDILGEPPPAPPRARRRIPLTSGLRWTVLSRDGFRCVICGRAPTPDQPLELQVDHITPICAGGGNDLTNLRTLCRDCNIGRGGRQVA